MKKLQMSEAITKGIPISRPQVTKDDIPANFLRHYPSLKSGKLNVLRTCQIVQFKSYNRLKSSFSFGKIDKI